MKDLIIVFDADEQPLVEKNGNRLNNQILDRVAKVLSNLRNQEAQVILVSAGAILAGMEQLDETEYPKTMNERQAYAAIGQVALIKKYQNLFDEYNHTTAQVLLARNITEVKKHRKNAHNTFKELFELGIIPIINENDTISTDDIEQDTNFPLTVTVANIIEADVIIRLNNNLNYEIIRSGDNTGKIITTHEELFDTILDYKRNGAFTPFLDRS